MAKVTLILEDSIDENGSKGLLIDWQSDNDYEEDSLAHQYATAFVQGVINNANKAEIIDKDAAIVTPKRNEDDSSLN